jgi:RimJ/RimL family protein N-acetyltransferase
MLEDRDLPCLVRLFGEAASYQFYDAFALGEAEIRNWYYESKQSRWADAEGCLNLLAETRERSCPVGYLSFYFVDDESRSQEHRQGACTFFVEQGSRRLGYGAEMLRGILDFGFLAIGLHDMRVGIDSRNTPARSLVEKVGMRHEGEFVQHKYKQGIWTNTTWYALLASEHRKTEWGRSRNSEQKS